MFVSELYSLRMFNSMFSGYEIGGILLYVWVLAGFVIYRRRKRTHLCNVGSVSPVILIFLGLFLSMVSAYVLYEQGFVQSLITYRHQYLWIIVIALLYVKPNERSLIKSLNWFGVTCIIATFLRTFFFPQWFVGKNGEQLVASEITELVVCRGYPILTIPLYYYCDRMRRDFKKKDVFWVCLYLFFFLMLQNRSTLFVATIIVGYSFVTSKKKKIAIPVTILLGLIFLYFSYDIFVDLNNETTSQINDGDYNRTKAFEHMFLKSNKDLLAIVFGKGFLSSHATNDMSNLMSLGIFNSDVGFIGYWDQFGILPVIVFVSIIIKTIFSKLMPFYVKASGLHILVCSVTISYFGTTSGIVWFSLFYFMFFYYENRGIQLKKRHITIKSYMRKKLLMIDIGKNMT